MPLSQRFTQCTVILLLATALQATAQYRVDFNERYNGFWPNHLPGWTTKTGDGNIIFRQKTEDGSAVLNVDARKDKRNIWYAFMHQSISDHIDFDKLSAAEYELRMEAKVMPSHAPRRINMYLSSLDAGGHLREFDLDKANEWHTISMVTSGFEFDPKKPLMAQISMMDWGIGDIFELRIDYIQVDLVQKGQKLTQHGLPLEYHPKLLKASAYKENLIAQSKMIDHALPDEVIESWRVAEGEAAIPLIQVDQSKVILLHWDVEKFKGKKVTGAGQLELSTHSLFSQENNPKDFGMIRFCEIRDPGKALKAGPVSYHSFTKNRAIDEVIVSQCIVDTKVNPIENGKTTVTISKPVLQRLIDGESGGIAILPLGLITASFFEHTHEDQAPRLRFNVE